MDSSYGLWSGGDKSDISFNGGLFRRTSFTCCFVMLTDAYENLNIFYMEEITMLISQTIVKTRRRWNCFHLDCCFLVYLCSCTMWRP